MPTCKKCLQHRTEAEMATFKKRGHSYLRGVCGPCEAQRMASRRTTESGREQERVSYEKEKAKRATGINADRYIVIDSRKSDKKATRANDLDREFVREVIKEGCSYCGETELRMTLDRVDNTLGHLKSNVVPACIRCNYTRKDMPHEAWLLVASGMRAAREAGAFDGWTGRIR